MQNSIARQLTTSLSEKLETDVSVGNVRYRLFNTFSLEDLYVQDLNRDTLLFVHKAHADFDFWRFFTGKLVFKQVKLDHFSGNMVIDSMGENNLKFIIQAFKKPPKTKKKSPVEFNFKNIQIANSSFKLTNLKREPLEDSARFDGRRMHFTDVNADLVVHYLRGDSLDVTFRSFSTKERSGLVVDNIEMRVYGLKTGFRLPYLNLKMPNSLLVMDSVMMEYDSVSRIKDIYHSVKFKSTIKPSSVALNDIAVFFPNFSGMTSPVSLQGNLDGSISNFRFKELEVQYKNTFSLKADVDMNGIPYIDETFIYADIKDFSVNRSEAQDLVAHITKRPFVLPSQFSKLGVVKYKGNVTGFFSNLVAYGDISTNIGALKTDILVKMENKLRDLRYNGTVQSSNFQLGELIGSDVLGKIAFKANTVGSKLHNHSLQGKITGSVSEIFLNQYTYRDIKLDGDYDGTGFEGQMKINDPNLKADFNGIADFSAELPVFNFELSVDNADLHALNLTDKYENSHLAFKANTNAVGNSLDNVNGYLLFDNIHFINAEKELVFDKFLLESSVEEGSSHFVITSDLINGYLDGDFKYSVIPAIATSTLQTYLPALSGQNVLKNREAVHGTNRINVDLTLNDTKVLSEVLELPIKLDGITTVKGFIDERAQDMNMYVSTPYVSFNKRTIQDVSLSMNNRDEQLNVLANGSYHQNNAHVNFNLKANASDDILHTQFGWHNRDSVLNEGELQFNTLFKKERNLSSALTSFLPTQIIINDSVWDVHTSQIAFNPDSTISISNFRLQNKDQYIAIDGLLSKNTEDLVLVNMNDIDLGFIMELINLRPISISGLTTGNANLYGVLAQPIFEADLRVKDAHLNNSPIGDAYIHSEWNRENEELLLSGAFLEASDTIALANGIYSFKQDSVDLVYDARKLNLGFLQRYLQSIVQNMRAEGTGTVRMWGKAGDIGFDGSVWVSDAKLKVDFLNTTYAFTDTVSLTRETINLKNIKIFDEEGNRGNLNGLLTHDGSFNDMEYDIKIDARNVLALNTKSSDNDYFYGKAYATGNIHIFGKDNETFMDINASTQPGTKMYISTAGKVATNSNDFITFVSRDTVAATAQEQMDRKRGDLSLTMQLEVSPNADVQFIINPESGDMISANGNGNIRLEHDNNTDLKLYGNYTIEKGNFLFTLQNLIRKQFRIEQGSNISWSGNPVGAQLEIKAVHALTASLYDLMSEDILASTDRTSVPVECILLLSDELMHPTIAFDVNLPSSDETLKMQVRNLMNTEEMMNRQMVYLLLFGKFYTPDYNRNASNMANSTSTGLSFLASTLSGQVNSWLSQISSNISLGVNYRASGYGSAVSQEYEGEIMYQPNNRFIINGNFGYRDDYLSKNKIIGDLDMEYILTENAKWRLKAYNHTVDRYSLRAAPFIQGVGIMYKENFNKWGDLWRDYMKVFQKEKKEQPDTVVNDSIQSNKTN